jgi:hypothetical protein
MPDSRLQYSFDPNVQIERQQLSRGGGGGLVYWSQANARPLTLQERLMYNLDHSYTYLREWLSGNVHGEDNEYRVVQLEENGTRRIYHLPPAQFELDSVPDMTNLKLYGLRGLVVDSLLTPLNEQRCKIVWLAIDIDHEPNAQIVDLPKRVVELLGDVGTVRLSKSGQGVHVFIRCTGMQMTGDYDHVKRLARVATRPYVERLVNAGIKPCVYGIPNVWVWSEGGLQKMIHVNETFKCDLSNVVVPCPTINSHDATGRSINPEQFNGKTLEVIQVLQKANVLPADLKSKTNVNIGRVRRALAGIVEFKTESKCRVTHEQEINGFIELTTDGTFALVSNPDNNSVVLRLISL